MKKLTITTLLAASIIAISSIANADTKVKVDGQFNYKYSIEFWCLSILILFNISLEHHFDENNETIY